MSASSKLSRKQDKKREILKQSATTCNSILSALAPVCAVVVLTACGGSPAEDEVFAQRLREGSVQHFYSKKKLRTAYPSGDFNPEIWGAHEWYECDCGKDASPVDSAPWMRPQ